MPILKAGKTIQINLGSMRAVELRESFVQMRSVTKMRIVYFLPSVGRSLRKKTAN
jgi:hypothetical protein